jgi:predicted transposase/invertase (TIGR01784 family)
VVGINLISFELGPVEDFHTSYRLWEDRHKDVLLTDVCEIHFLDMVKFRRAGKHDLENPLDRWLVYFDERSPETLIEEVINMDSAIRLVQKKRNQTGLDPGLRRACEGIEKAERDRISGLNAVNRKLAQAKRETARNLKTNGVSVEQIAKSTGLSEVQIGKLQGGLMCPSMTGSRIVLIGIF